MISEKQLKECRDCVFDKVGYHNGCTILTERCEPCHFFTSSLYYQRRKKGGELIVNIRKDVDLDAEVVKLFNQNFPTGEIAHLLNLTESHVVRILENGGYI